MGRYDSPRLDNLEGGVVVIVLSLSKTMPLVLMDLVSSGLLQDLSISLLAKGSLDRRVGRSFGDQLDQCFQSWGL